MLQHIRVLETYVRFAFNFGTRHHGLGNKRISHCADSCQASCLPLTAVTATVFYRVVVNYPSILRDSIATCYRCFLDIYGSLTALDIGGAAVSFVSLCAKHQQRRQHQHQLQMGKGNIITGVFIALMAGVATGLAPKILILGGTGFIGSTISRIAVNSGFEVCVLYHVCYYTASVTVICRGAAVAQRATAHDVRGCRSPRWVCTHD